MYYAFRLGVRLSLYLLEVEDGRVTVLTLFGQKGRDPTVRFRHQIVYDDQVSSPGVEQRRAWHAFFEQQVGQRQRRRSAIPRRHHVIVSDIEWIIADA